MLQKHTAQNYRLKIHKLPIITICNLAYFCVTTKKGCLQETTFNQQRKIVELEKLIIQGTNGLKCSFENDQQPDLTAAHPP